MQPASMSSRFAAMNLDMIIFGVLWQALSITLEKYVPEYATPGQLLVLILVFSLIYFVYPTKKSGQTLGKKLLNLKVVPKENDRDPLGWGQAFLREFLGKLLSCIPFFLGYIWAYFQRDGRAWHDFIGNTQVISLVWEDEKTLAQKLQQVLLAIISIPAGVALITVAFLYTSLPLDSIKEKIEASGIQVASLTGSLAGGLHFSEIRRQDQGQNFSLASVDVKFNLWALLTDSTFYIEKITADEGHLDVPEDFSLVVILANLLAAAQFQGTGAKSLNPNLTMAKLHFKNIYFENNKKVLSHLQELSVKSLAIADNELYLNELQIQIVGFVLKAQEVKSSFGRIEIGKASGGVTPEFLPLLKVPVDFHFQGAIGQNPKQTKIEAGLMIDKIKITYEAGNLAAQVDKLTLNEMFKTAMPIDELDLKLSAKGTTVLDLLGTLNVEYGLKLCGQEFKPDPVQGPTLARADRQFHFRMVPLPVLDFNQVVFTKEATLDDLFGYELRGIKQITPAFASNQEMLADLCFQKPVSGLQALEVESLKPLEKVVQQAPKQSAGFASMIATTAPESESVKVSSAIAAADPEESKEREEAGKEEKEADIAELKAVVSEAKGLLKQGKFNEAKVLLEAPPVAIEGVPTSDQGAFYNLRAWVYLYTNSAARAAQNFEMAFEARKDIGDAEGLQRSYEALKKDQDAQKWWDYIKSAVKANPGLKNQLTPNMQKKLLSEASAESRP